MVANEGAERLDLEAYAALQHGLNYRKLPPICKRFLLHRNIFDSRL